jgi:hypothetical protein
MAGAFYGSQFGQAFGHRSVAAYRRWQQDTDDTVVRMGQWLDHDAPVWLRRLIGRT